jgi:hypothetical protein
LDYLFNLFALAKEAACNEGDPSAVTIEQLLEGRFISTTDARHKLYVRRLDTFARRLLF